MEVRLQNVRLGHFPDLFTARAGEDDNGNPTTPKYGAQFILEPGTQAYKDLERAQLAVAKEKYKDDCDKIMKKFELEPLKKVLRPGELRSEYDGFEGNFWCKAANTVRPTIVDRDRTPLVEADGKPYAGCMVNAIIDVWAQDNKFGKRVNAKLLAVQFVKDGDALGRSSAPMSADVFEVLDGADAGDLE